MRKNYWIDKLDDETISSLMKKKDLLDNIPDTLDEKIIKIIRNSSLDRTNKYEFSKKRIFYKIRKIALIAVIILTVFIPVFYILKYNPDLFYNEQLSLSVLGKNGDVQLNNRNKFIKTSKNSNLSMKIGTNSTIKIEESSEIKNIISVKLKNKEINKIELAEGKIECNVNLLNKDSTFQILTNICVISVKGTRFRVEYSKDKNLKVEVSKGIVEISNYIKPDKNVEKIRNIDKKLYESINELNKSKITINKGNFIDITKNDFDDLNNNLVLIINTMLYNKNDKFTKSDKEKILKQLDNLKTKSQIFFELKENTIEDKKTDINNDSTQNKNDLKLQDNSNDLKLQKLVNHNNQILKTENYLFLYNWNENQVLDENIEKLKKEIIDTYKITKTYSSNISGLENLYKNGGNILFFINYENFKEDIDSQRIINDYCMISIDEVKRLLLNKNSVFISKNIKNKNFILFIGKEDNGLIKSINENKNKIF